MAQPAPIYDLVVLLDSNSEDAQRTEVLDACVRIVSASGEVIADEDWGLRALAYEIKHKPDAQYHLLQFRAPTDAIEELNRMLHIADGVVRYRIIKLKPGTRAASTATEADVQAAEPADVTA